MMKVVVIGSNGQLGKCMKENQFPILPDVFDVVYATHDMIDITEKDSVKSYFDSIGNDVDFVVNCAAYTDVNKAETDSLSAFKVNVIGPLNLAMACNDLRAMLIHISTDFIYDGQQNRPYREDDAANPLSVYGMTKFEGEEIVKSISNEYAIIRTSWLYSEHGNNFVKKIIETYKKNPFNGINVVNNEIGSPTYAGDLAEFIYTLIIKKVEGSLGDKEVFNYSNQGTISRYDFANAIIGLYDDHPLCKINQIVCEQPKVKRPFYSAFDLSKSLSYATDIPYYMKSLSKCINKIINREK